MCFIYEVIKYWINVLDKKKKKFEIMEIEADASILI